MWKIGSFSFSQFDKYIWSHLGISASFLKIGGINSILAPVMYNLWNRNVRNVALKRMLIAKTRNRDDWVLTRSVFVGCAQKPVYKSTFK